MRTTLSQHNPKRKQSPDLNPTESGWGRKQADPVAMATIVDFSYGFLFTASFTYGPAESERLWPLTGHLDVTRK